MSSVTLNAVWIGSFRASLLEAEQLHAKILAKAELSGIAELVSNVSSSANSLVQFVIMPCSSKDGFPDNVAWEKLYAFTVTAAAIKSFQVKKIYIGEL